MARVSHAASRHEVRWCFHASALVADYELTRDALAWLIGCRPLEDHSHDDPAIGRRGGMTWVGDNSIELGEPSVPGGETDRFVQRFGSHMSSVAVQIADSDGTVAFLEEHEAPVAARIDGDILFTSPKGTAGVVVEWFGGVPPNDPRFGAGIPAYSVQPLLEVTNMAFVGAVVAQPAHAADRLAHLFGTAVTFVDDDAPLGQPRAGVSIRDLSLALFELPDAGASEELWGYRYRRPMASSLGVRVPDLATAFAALTTAGVPLVRRDERSIVVHPSATGGVLLVVVDELLPGDPRLDTNDV